MCTIFFSYNRHPDYWLIVAANRDEFYERPTRHAAFWEENPAILAGRDLRGNGTWMGITRGGRMAAITNVRDPESNRADAPTRGNLVVDFLATRQEPRRYLETLRATGARYNGFNLILGNGSTLCYYTNRNGGAGEIPPGVHGLSNGFLNTPWPKVRTGTERFAALVEGGGKIEAEALFSLLQDERRAPDALLPHTGVGIEWERILSSLHISSEVYGTRSATLLFMGRDGRVTYLERTYPRGTPDRDRHETRRFDFTVSP